MTHNLCDVKARLQPQNFRSWYWGAHNMKGGRTHNLSLWMPSRPGTTPETLVRGGAHNITGRRVSSRRTHNLTYCICSFAVLGGAHNITGRRTNSLSRLQAAADEPKIMASIQAGPDTLITQPSPERQAGKPEAID